MSRVYIFLLYLILACYIPSVMAKTVGVLWWNNLNSTEIQDSFHFGYMAEKLQKKGYNLKVFYKTGNYYEDVDVLLIAYPYWNKKEIIYPKKTFLWLLESPIFLKGFDPQKDKSLFKQVFTYNKNLANEFKFKWCMIPYRILQIFQNKKDKLFIQISGYKTNVPMSIYNKRCEISDWFVNNHPDDFLLYGRNWNNCPNEQVKQMWKGAVKDKLETASYGKFMFAFENAKATGYITEKIFDAMVAGSIPVYLGAPDIYDYIPKNCLINLEDFSSYDEMYDVLANMPEEKVNEYRSNIQEFLSHFDQTPFYYKTVIDQIIDTMISE